MRNKYGYGSVLSTYTSENEFFVSIEAEIYCKYGYDSIIRNLCIVLAPYYICCVAERSELLIIMYLHLMTVVIFRVGDDARSAWHAVASTRQFHRSSHLFVGSFTIPLST